MKIMPNEVIKSVTPVVAVSPPLLRNLECLILLWLAHSGPHEYRRAFRSLIVHFGFLPVRIRPWPELHHTLRRACLLIGKEIRHRAHQIARSSCRPALESSARRAGRLSVFV